MLLPFLLLTDTDPPDTEPPDDDDEIRDPKALVRSLREANERLAKKVQEREERIAELEDTAPGDDDSLWASRLEAAFLREILARKDGISDLETAWDLANARGYLDPVKLSEDGTVEGMTEAFDRLLDRYPYLREKPAEPPRDPPSRPSGRQPGSPKKSRSADRAALANRFPALRRGR